ncbi:MAG: haloacid dehalogenase type II [Bacillota bacterium]
MENVKALFWDVFGTLVDWRTGIARESRALLEPLGVRIDWLEFADAWRGEYQPAMEEVRSGREPFVPLDVLHRRMLETTMRRLGLRAIDGDTATELTLAWHKLDAWDDAKRNFGTLRRAYLMAPVSNGNIALMVDLARRNDFRWDAILGAEIAQDYKPKPRAYLASVEALGLRPSECMMVAAHSADLKAAAQVGLRTAHVARMEEAPGKGEPAPTVPVDVAASSFDDLVAKLGLVKGAG